MKSRLGGDEAAFRLSALTTDQRWGIFRMQRQHRCPARGVEESLRAFPRLPLPVSGCCNRRDV